MNSQIEFKANTGQVNVDKAQGIVECFVAGIGNKDSVGDIVVSGAFAKSLARRKPRVVWGHNWNDPIGKVLEIYEVPPNDPRLPAKMKMAGIGGLFAKVQFNLNSEKGKEAFANIAFFGEEQEWSIGYKTLDAIYDNALQANVLREVELYEVSPVLHGANQLTGTISVKSEEEKMHMFAGGLPTGMMVSPPAVSPKPEEAQQPRDPFSQGIAMPLSDERISAITQELVSRTGGPITVIKATDSSVTFNRPGRGIFRLGYYFDGTQFMFGKPELLTPPMSAMVRPATQPSVPAIAYSSPRNPENSSIVFGTVIPKDYGKTAFDELDFILNEINQETKVGRAINNRTIVKLKNIIDTLQDIVGSEMLTKSSFMIECEPKHAFQTKQLLDPVFDFHRIETLVTENGILITSEIDNDAFQAIDTATKGVGKLIGRAIGGGGGKVRRARGALAKITGELDRNKRRDGNNNGRIFDNTPLEQPTPPRLVGLRSESRTSNSSETSQSLPYNTEATRSVVKKLLDSVDEMLKTEDSQNPFVALRELQNVLKKNQGKNEVVIPFDRALIDSSLKEISKAKTTGQATDEFLENSLKQVVNQKGGSLRARGKGGGAKINVVRKMRVGGTLNDQSNLTPSGLVKIRKMSEIRPKNWNLMSFDEREDWLVNESPGLGLSPTIRARQLEINSVEEDEAVKKEIRKKKKDRFTENAKNRRAESSETRAVDSQEASEPIQETSGSSSRGKPERKTSRFTEATEVLRRFLDGSTSGKGNIRKSLDRQTRDLLIEIDDLLGDGETPSSLNKSIDLINKFLSEMNLDLTEQSTVKEGKLKDYLERVSSSMSLRADEIEDTNVNDSTPELDPLSDLGRATGDGLGDDDEDFTIRYMMRATDYLAARNRKKQNGSRSSGLRSTSDNSKAPRTQINAEATWWNKIETSIPKEIQKATDEQTKKGLKLLETILKRQESGKLGPNRTNAGSLTISADEADKILEAVMSVIDRQTSTSGSRGEIFAELLEKIANSAMSTFIEKTTPSVGGTSRTATNSRGQSVTLKN